jgi:hypothetical protein
MKNVGEEIAGVYLQAIKGCDFVQYNLYTPDTQGEIDVVAINRKERVVYICEVAVHLVTGLQYVKDRRPDNVRRFIAKFEKDIDYGEEYFPDHERVYMLWSPIVRNQRPDSKYNQVNDVEEIVTHFRETRGVEILPIINERYFEVLRELRAYAGSKTEALQSPILRLMQIEERLGRHLGLQPV